ncbi:fungal specific transcription factor domain protein [Seiridium cupressi]
MAHDVVSLLVKIGTTGESMGPTHSVSTEHKVRPRGPVSGFGQEKLLLGDTSKRSFNVFRTEQQPNPEYRPPVALKIGRTSHRLTEWLMIRRLGRCDSQPVISVANERSSVIGTSLAPIVALLNELALLLDQALEERDREYSFLLSNRIEDRLSSIESLLQNIVAPTASPGRAGPGVLRTALRFKRSNGGDVAQPADEPIPLFEGGSSLAAHTTLVSNQVSHNVKQTSPPGLDNDIHAALSALRHIVENEFDLATFIVVNGGLFHLFGGRALIPEELDDPDIRADFLYQYRNMCADNMVAALGSLSLFMPANAVNIEALLLGTNYAIEASRPSLAWKMSNVAAQMCQTLGYHQMPPLSDVSGDTTDYERRTDTFRYTYKLNKALALRLGRVSAFQDYDISVPLFSVDNCGGNLWRRVIAARVQHAKVQGEIYDQLYSSKALREPPGQRTQCAMALAESIKAMVRDLYKIRAEFGRVRNAASLTRTTEDASELILGSEMVSYHSSLTLIYRSVPQSAHGAGAFASECVEAARVAFQQHHECLRIAMSPIAQTGYIHWTLLFAPFTPLIVIFCHAIESLDEADLLQLEGFASSIEHVSPLSEAIEQLYRLAQALYNIALLYVKAKKSQVGMQGTVPLERDFEAYLTQLGLTMPDTGHTAVSNAPNVPAQSAPLGGWFAGNVTMMGLLEEDLTGFFP